MITNAMPKVKWLSSPVRVYYLNDLFDWHIKDKHITSETLGKRLRIEPASVRRKKCRGVEKFSMADFKAWTKAIGIPPDEAAHAVYEYLTHE